MEKARQNAHRPADRRAWRLLVALARAAPERSLCGARRQILPEGEVAIFARVNLAAARWSGDRPEYVVDTVALPQSRIGASECPLGLLG
jgi:hypothetical protein